MAVDKRFPGTVYPTLHGAETLLGKGAENRKWKTEREQTCQCKSHRYSAFFEVPKHPKEAFVTSAQAIVCAVA